MHGCLERLRISGVSKANCTAGIKGCVVRILLVGGRGAGGPSPSPVPHPRVLPAGSPGMPRPRVAAWQRLGSPGSALLGPGRPSQLGSHMLQVFGSLLLLVSLVSDRARLAGALDLRLPVSQGKPLRGQGPVRIRAVPVPAWPQPAASPSAAERSWAPPCQAVPAGPGATSWALKGCVSCCHREWKCSAGGRAWVPDPNGCSSAGCAGWPAQGSEPGQSSPGGAREGLHGTCRLCITRTAGSQRGEGGPRCPEAAGASPCASLSLSQGWQGCAGGHGRRRTPALLSDFAG